MLYFIMIMTKEDQTRLSDEAYLTFKILVV